MELSSLIFVFLFLPIFLLLFFILRQTAHNSFLLIASLVFYAWGESEYILVLLVSVTVNYLLGLLMDKTDGKRSRKTVFLAAVIFNLGLLIYFKYTYFILDNLGLAGSFGSIHLPMGISFFTFQALSYIIDIYRKTVPNDRDPIRFGLYMTFFPKLITGPITPYHNLSKQITHRVLNLDDFAEGVKRFIFGLGKKVLIADTVARTADHVFAVPVEQQTAGLAWLGVLSYGLQIYFDFSGYTDMAIGTARMFGFKLPENFNYPYIADSIKDFWTRWHISLAHWLRDYLFLPIAYAVMRRIKQDRLLRVKVEHWSYTISAFTTFLLCGLWHGAAWTFMLWGVFYGVLLIIEHLGLRKFLKRKPRAVRIFYTQFMVMMGWVFFRSDGLGYAWGYFKAMFGFGGGDGRVYYPALYMDPEIALFMVIGILGCLPLFPALKKWFGNLKSRWETGKRKFPLFLLNSVYTVMYTVYLTAVLSTAAMYLAAGTYKPFIYARF